MKGSNIKTICMVLLFVALAGLSGFFAYEYTVSRKNLQKMHNKRAAIRRLIRKNRNMHRAQSDVDTSTTESASGETSSSPSCAGTFEINGNTLTLPSGWCVVGVLSEVHNLTDQEIANAGMTSGAWPIYRKFDLTFSNGSTTADFIYEPIFVPGGFGGTVTELDTSVYTVVDEPTADYVYDSVTPDMVGIAQSNDEFVMTVKNMPGTDTYFNMSHSIEARPYMEYTGTDTVDVQALFTALCKENLSGYCY